MRARWLATAGEECARILVSQIGVRDARAVALPSRARSAVSLTPLLLLGKRLRAGDNAKHGDALLLAYFLVSQ